MNRSVSSVDLATCYRSLRNGSHTFFAASLLLPKRFRAPASALYAFCRMADDAIDGGADVDDELQKLGERLSHIYSAQPLPNVIDRALAYVVDQYAIPRALPEALLEGFAWDATHRRYENIEALQAYAARVAGTVGAMMSLIMGARAPETVARACDLGTAMQLTNIARDVGEDARAGRLYLPLDWLREAGLDPEEWLRRPLYCKPLGEVVARLLDSADEIYARAALGIPQLPRGCRPAIHAARLMYAEIGREVERHDLDSVSTRAVVTKSRKLRLLVRAMIASAWAPVNSSVTLPPLAQNAFLVNAVVQQVVRERVPAIQYPSETPWWNLAARIEWVLQLFEQLEARQRVSRLSEDT